MIMTRHVTDMKALDELTNKFIADARKCEDEAELKLIATCYGRAVQQ